MNTDKELLRQQIEKRGIVEVLADISEIYGETVAVESGAYSDKDRVAVQAIAMQIKTTWEFALTFLPNF